MNKKEAEAFLLRNPNHTRDTMHDLLSIAREFKLETFYDFGAASNDQDALQDLLIIARVLEREI